MTLLAFLASLAMILWLMDPFLEETDRAVDAISATGDAGPDGPDDTDN